MMRDFCREENPKVAELRAKIDHFYQTTTTYEAFQEDSLRPEFWQPVRDEIEKQLKVRGTCRVLEFGAGRTVFRKWLGDLGPKITFHVQDVTTQNQEHLNVHADAVFIGDVRTVNEKYDVIFSTFAWEHITDPRGSLDHLLSRLNPAGSLILVSPRYDFPGYLSPSAKHYSRPRRWWIASLLLLRRLFVLMGREADFLIHTDPCLLHRPWFRDTDAIHWVSLWDLKQHLGRRWTVTQAEKWMQPGQQPTALQRFLNRQLLLFVIIQQRPQRP